MDGLGAEFDPVDAEGDVMLTWGQYTSNDPCAEWPPTITGTPQVGRTLTASNGTWAGRPSGFGNQWVACDLSGCGVIAGATNASFLVPADLLGSALYAIVTARHPSDPTKDAVAYSALTDPVLAAPPPPPPPPPPLKIRCHVPAVKGKSLSIARRRIAAAHCRIGHIRRVKSRKPKGIVLAQRPRAGKTLPRASRVSLVVSRGGKR